MDEVVFKYRDVPDMTDINVAKSHGTYKAWQKAQQMSADSIIETVKESGLRGRGRTGFPTGVKWSFMLEDDTHQSFLVCNANESEPGTFKDREIMLKIPHSLIEGCAIACRAIRAKKCFIYIRGEFVAPYNTLLKALQEAYQDRQLGAGVGVDIEIYRGAGAHICGEETALMNSLQGDRGYPGEPSPFPAQKGFWRNPTTVNNVETLTSVAPIVLNGADWYKQWGTRKSTGTKIFSLSGHVVKPGNYELPIGTSLRDIIYGMGMGVSDDREIKAVIPGGLSTPVLDSSKLDVLMDYESLVEAGSMLGSGGVIVMDETVDMVKATLSTAEFYAHESCGKCTPCRQGSWWLVKILKRIVDGNGKMDDIELMLDICDNIEGRSYCLLGDACAIPVRGFIMNFKDEFEAKIKR